ncbi:MULTISPECIES: hypothetical protein [Chelatococcus]|uniref:Uncharacterized protein n=1 Tax=Chelatococcus caeni TaxID=1348468 RepID=A0A840C9C6_9HYPH|nr:MULTISPECIES: hypothetical protein [Chelatococcus]MBB4019979.1 hypothetical protein [Chelatococcus caeni]
MPKSAALPAALLLALAAAPGSLARDKGESPFAAADAPPAKPAACHEIRDLIRDAPDPEETARIDFGAVGPLSLVEHDGALAYLGICTEPDVRVLCVTYSTNGMQPGEVVAVTGGYQRADEDLVILDPCLAARPGEGG